MLLALENILSEKILLSIIGMYILKVTLFITFSQFVWFMITATGFVFVHLFIWLSTIYLLHR